MRPTSMSVDTTLPLARTQGPETLSPGGFARSPVPPAPVAHLNLIGLKTGGTVSSVSSSAGTKTVRRLGSRAVSERWHCWPRVLGPAGDGDAERARVAGERGREGAPRAHHAVTEDCGVGESVIFCLQFVSPGAKNVLFSSHSLVSCQNLFCTATILMKRKYTLYIQYTVLP